MVNRATTTKLAHPFCPVKSSQLSMFSDSPDTMIHHNVPSSISKPIIVSYKNLREPYYGVSSARRAITSSVYIKKYDHIRECLKDVLKLTTAEREVTLRLLRFWSYYGKAYPKESQVTELPGCSKATFWRTIKLLKELGLIQVVNRYVIRPHAQISNLYRLDRLALLLAKYLAEHGTAFYEKWLQPYLSMPGGLFWGGIYQTSEARAGPRGLVLVGP